MLQHHISQSSNAQNPWSACESTKCRLYPQFTGHTTCLGLGIDLFLLKSGQPADAGPGTNLWARASRWS